jgi:hypothetical protein
MLRGIDFTGVPSLPCCEIEDLASDLSEVVDDWRESAPKFGRRSLGEPDTTDPARDETGLPLLLLFALPGVMTRSDSGRSTWPATDVWLTAILGSPCGSSDSVEAPRIDERPRRSAGCDRAADRSRTVLSMRRPAPPSKPPRCDPPGESRAKGVPGRPGELGGDSLARLPLRSPCFTVRTDPEVDVIVRERSGGGGLGEDVDSLSWNSTVSTDSGRSISWSKKPVLCFSVSGLAVTLLDSGCSPSLEAFNAENMDSSPRRLERRAS